MGVVDFNRDIVEAVANLVPAEVTGWNAIRDMTADDAWLAYGNWLSRHIEPRPRAVHVSRELEQVLRDHPESGSVQTVLREVECGDDLTPRLSTRTIQFFDATNANRGLNRRRDLDLLLNDWGVHHLHLGPRVAGERFVQRSSNLLLVAVLGDCAYAITLLAHGPWADESILRIMADNWPEEGVLHRLRGVSGLSDVVSPESRAALRNAGLSVLYEHSDGYVYAPRGMMSTAGTSMALGVQRDPAMMLIRRVERAISSAPEGILDVLVSARSGQRVSPSDVHLEVIPDLHQWALRDRVTGALIPLDAVEHFLKDHPTGQPVSNARHSPSILPTVG